VLVTENVHQIRSGYHGIYAAVYLIADAELTLVDAGETESWQRDILPYIRGIGRDHRELRRVIHTHGHDDHVHGDLQIREQTGAEIWISEQGAKFLEQPGSRAAWEESLYEGCLSEEEREAIRLGTDYNGPPRREEVIRVDRRYRSGEALNAGSLELRAIHAPGHTSDSFCLYEKRRGLLFTGDAVNGEGTAFDDLAVYQDLPALERTMRRLERLELNLLLAAHPYLPFKESVLDADKARQLMRCTAEASRRMAVRIEQLLQASSRWMSTGEISARICAEFGPNRPAPRGHGTVRLLLRQLLHEGKASVSRQRGGIWWSWKGG
jgi:glyoxylase-like metal-dependent hydrolase (beta-lactamase superfamily II)